MAFLRGFAKFWYDFVIGDDWKIAAAVAAVLLAGAVLVRRGGLPDALAATLVGVGVLLAFAVAVAVDVRRNRPR